METENLIEQVRKYTFLYNPGHPEYKNVAKKNKKWREIGLVLNLRGKSFLLSLISKRLYVESFTI